MNTGCRISSDAIVEGHAESVMASYNAINGTPNNINHWLLTDVLKNEWHFEGFVVSDLGGVGTMVAGHGATDDRRGRRRAVADGRLRFFRQGISGPTFPPPCAMASSRRSGWTMPSPACMRVRLRLGEFDPFESVPYSKIPTTVINSAEHRALALKVAQESIVLLQNRGGLLPLDKTKLKRIAVIGPLADRIVMNNYNGKPAIP